MVFASRNPHKLRELQALLAPHSLEPLPDGLELPPESGDSFRENALLKACAVARATGRTALADDSGIEVMALGGGPGIHSARFAGETATDDENLAKLIRLLDGAEDRRAAYVCVLALTGPNRGERTFEARCEGRLIDTPRGAGGFGYDPIFVPEEHDSVERTMAELAPEEKDLISHRGRAARMLATWLSSQR